MKRFLLVLIIFLIPLFVVLVCLEGIARNVPNEYKYKAEWMEQHADSVETLIFGSSHAFYGIDPKVIGKNTFSMAFTAQIPLQDQFLFHKYINDYKNLKRVILVISYFSLFDDGKGERGENWRNVNYKVYFDAPMFANFSKNSFFIFHPKPLEEKFLKFLHGNKSLAVDKNGFGYPIFKKKQTHILDKTSAQVWVNLHTVKNWQGLDENVKYVEKMITDCKKLNVDFIIVTTPTWHTYYERLNQEQLDKMHEVIHNLQKQYSIKYIDMMKDPRFNEKDFTDCNHMSCVGAQKLSAILKDSICVKTIDN